MSKPITVRDDIYEKVKQLKGDKLSFSGAIDEMFKQIDFFAKEYQNLLNSLQEAHVTQEGRVRGLSGKTILYRIKENEKHIESDGVITLPIPKPETTRTEEPLISIGKEESKEEENHA